MDWENHRHEYLQRAELERLSDCQATLRELKLRLNQQYQQTNEHVQQGGNSLLKFRPDGTFHVTTPKAEETDSLSLLGFFPERKYISLLEVLSTVNQATGFLDEFEHWQHKYQRPKPPEKVFFAGLMGYGCEIGQSKLAQISRQINESELENTINWFFFAAQSARGE